MKEEHHVDLSVKFWKRRATGIACVAVSSKYHVGCALISQLKKGIIRHLFTGHGRRDRARLYAICIYYLIKDITQNIRRLIICNDEYFLDVRQYIGALLVSFDFDIISLSEYRKEIGRNIKSPADKPAAAYANRALSKSKREKGRALNVVEINYKMVLIKWNKIKV